MPSATDFLPSSMTEFMNFDSTMSPNFGSGRISRFSGRRRREILLFLYRFRRFRNLSGAYSFFRPHGESRGLRSERALRPSPRGPGSRRDDGLFGTLGAVLG